MFEDALEEDFEVSERVDNLLSICGEQMFTMEEMLQLAQSFLHLAYDDLTQQISSLGAGDETETIELNVFATTIANMTRIRVAAEVLSEIILEDDNDDE